MGGNSSFNLQLWGLVCAGEYDSRTIYPSSVLASLIWTGDHIPLCSQWLLQAVAHLPLIFSSSYYAGLYYRARYKRANRTALLLIGIISVLFTLISSINFFNLTLPSSKLSIVMISSLIVKWLTWLLHSFCIFTLVGSLDRPPAISIFSWLLVLISDLVCYLALVRLKVHSDWAIPIDSPFLQADFFLYTFSIGLFLHISYAVIVIFSYSRPKVNLLLRRWRLRNSPSYAHMNIQQSYGSIGGEFEFEQGDRPVNEEGASWLSYLFFTWFNQTIKKGFKKKIESLDDLPSLPKTLKGSYLLAKFNRFYTDKQLNGMKSNKWRLLLSVIQVAGYRFYLAGFLKLIADAVTFTGPLLLNGLVYLVENNSQPIYYGYLYAFGLFMSSLISMLLNVHFQYLVDKVSVSIKSAVMNAVYQKVIRLNLSRLTKFSSGEVLDFMSTDAGRLSSVWNVHLFWSMPVMIMICLYLLYLQVGLSFLAGLGFCLAIILINQVLTVLITRVFKRYMQCKDERIRMMSEILAGIRVIKLYAWERIFKNKIGKIRADELRQLAWVKCLDGFCVFFWACTATMMSVLTFITYSQMGNELTAARVFTSVSLFAILIGPLNGFPLVLQWLAEAWVSLTRLENFLSVEELNEEEYYSFSPPADPNVVLCIQRGEFAWDCDKNKAKESTALNPIERPILKGIDIIVHSRQFVGIVGKVGSGKSSIFSALTMELSKRCGTVYYGHLNKGFGYVSQESWIQHGTLRSNILFGQTYNPDLYERVVSACALLPDFAIAHAGDLTEVGENGVNLSGGQKARINLARACYQQKPCMLLDDPLSAVDANVAQHIFSNCFLKLLSSTTRLLITHRVNFLQSADLVVVVNNGKIVSVGAPGDILPQVERRCEVVEKEGDTQGGEEGVNLKDNPEDILLVKKEEKCSGSVKFSIYWSYWRSIGHFFALLILFTMFLMESSKRATDVWLSVWTTANVSRTHSNTSSLKFSHKDNSDTLYYLEIYAGLSLATGLVTIFRAASFAVGTFRASKWIHSQLYHRITRATILFFDSTPIGRLLNRFSSDLYTIDFDLPFNLNIFLAQIFSLAGAVIITIYGLPLICVLLVFLSIFYFLIQFYYRRTSRELKRIASISMSPVYSHFTETFAGIATIKAMRASDRFFLINTTNIDHNQQANFTSNIAAGWFRIRIQIISIMVVTGVALFAVLQHQLFVPVNAGLLGLALSYAITLTGILGSTVETFTQLEMLMVAVERIDEYTNTTPVEDILFSNRKNNTHSRSIFPQSRAPSITFHKVSLRYREGLPYALRDVSFQVSGGEKLGVVGRTGAGKSSLFRVLFRLVDLTDGKVLMDGVDSLSYSLEQLRSSLAAIPQDPFLFSGTVRENLSPDTRRYDDVKLWDSLEGVYLKEVVGNMGGLDASVGIGGKNFSTGQRQLICLARAILTRPQVLCIDEATANIDTETDEQIQTVIQNRFRASTVITIAHRINTIMHCDRVLVMESGRVVEHASPRELLTDHNSAFSDLASVSL